MEYLGDIYNALRNSTMHNNIALGAIRIIKKRTRESRDVSGNAFAPYSKGYIKKREKYGKQTETVQLQFDDYFSMMGSINHVVSQDLESISIQFDDDDKAQLALYHSEMGAGKSKVIRNFWGFSPEEQNQINQLAGIEVGKILKNL